MKRKNKIPFFSILIPVYGNVDFFSECIGSILNQDFEDYEIILCIQGKTKIKTQNNKKIQIIYQEVPSSYIARKTLFNCANGHYILFVDADDFLEEDALTTLCQKILITNSLDLYEFNYNIYCNKSKIQATFDKFCIINSKVFLNQFLTSQVHNTVWRKCIKNKRIDFFEGNIFMGDDALMMLPIILSAESVCILDEVLYCYRKNELSFSKKYIDAHFDDLCFYLLASYPYRRTDEQKDYFFSLYIKYFIVFYSKNNDDLLNYSSVKKIYNMLSELKIKVVDCANSKLFNLAVKNRKMSFKFFFFLFSTIEKLTKHNFKIRLRKEDEA